MLWDKKKAVLLSILCAASSICFSLPAFAAEETVSKEVTAAEEPVSKDVAATEETASNELASAGKPASKEVAADEETMSGSLEELVVEGKADKVLPGGYIKTEGAVGILGKKDVMSVPYTQTNFTAQNIEDFGGPNQAIDNILVNMPSVRQTGTMLHGDFSVRGRSTNGSFFYLNGVPGMMGQFYVPTFMAESIEVTAGPNKAISGTFPTGEGTGVAAVVNVTSKKATDEPVTRYRQTFSGESGFGEAFDIGRRFGKNNEWGIRINAEFLNGNPTHYKTEKNSQSFFANIDHTTEKSKTNLLIGYQYYEVEDGMRWFNFSSTNIKNGLLTHLPNAPNARNNYSFPGMDKVTEGTLMVLNHEQKFADDWKWFFNGGWSRSNLRKNITGKSSKLTILSDDGTYDGSYFTRRTPTHKYYTQFGINGQFETGEVKHDVVLAADKSWYKSWTGVLGGTSITNFSGLGGNIYTGVDPNESVTIPDFQNYHNSSYTYWGVSLLDTMTLGKTQLLLGVHKHEANNVSYTSPLNGDVTTTSVKSDATCPAYGLVYSPNDNVAFYASHSEFFDSGERVSSGYENEYEVLDPSKSKSDEVGIKYENKGLMVTLALFQSTEASSITIYNDDSTKKWLANDGENRYRGVELSINGRLTDKWNIMGGFMYMRSERTQTESGTYHGYEVSGIPKWNAVAALQYRPDKAWSILGRAVYVGDTPIFPASNEVKWTVPSYVTFDLGVKYKTKINKVPVTFDAICYNLFDRDYWIAYGSGVHLSSPRTVMFSATFDL